MTTKPLASDAADRPSGRGGVRWAVVLLVVLAVALAGGLIVRTPSVVFWLGGTLLLEGRVHAGEETVSLETEDWFYGMSPFSTSWTDAAGTWHDGGRPACLVPGDHSSTVRFAAVQVTVDGTTWRPVVWVDCRGTPIDGAAAQAAP